MIVQWRSMEIWHLVWWILESILNNPDDSYPDLELCHFYENIKNTETEEILNSFPQNSEQHDL